MSKRMQIPVHSMDDWFSGVYIKPFGTGKPAVRGYEISRPHRHDFYYCVLLGKGKMDMEIDFETLQIKGNSLFFSYPGQIHSIVANEMEQGWFLAFDPAILDAKLKSILDQRLSEVMHIPLSGQRVVELNLFFSSLYAVYRDQERLFCQLVIQAMVTALGYQVASAYLSMEQSGLVHHSDRSITITKDFKQLLRAQFRSVKRPSEYAANMNLTVSHLNDCVKSVTGFAVTSFIQQEVVREAQRLLYYSDLSIKEIADILGYDDAKYFSRLFSKLKGTSPGAFRKRSLTI